MIGPVCGLPDTGGRRILSDPFMHPLSTVPLATLIVVFFADLALYISTSALTMCVEAPESTIQSIEVLLDAREDEEVDTSPMYDLSSPLLVGLVRWSWMRDRLLSRDVVSGALSRLAHTAGFDVLVRRG